MELHTNFAANVPTTLEEAQTQVYNSVRGMEAAVGAALHTGLFPGHAIVGKVGMAIAGDEKASQSKATAAGRIATDLAVNIA